MRCHARGARRGGSRHRGARPCRCALGNDQFLAWRGGQHDRPDGIPGTGVRPLDAGQSLSARPGAIRADRHRQPAVLPGRLRRHRRVCRRLLLHRLRPADRLWPRGGPERRRLRVRAGAGDHLSRHCGNHGEAAGAGAVGQRPQPEQLRDRPGAGRRGLVEERPGERRHLRRDRHQPGHLLRLCGGEARLRLRGEEELDAGIGLGADGGPGPGQRQLCLEGGPGVFVPVGRHPACRVRHVGLGHGDRHRPDLRRRQLGTARARAGTARPRPPGHGDPDGRRRRPAGLPLRHQYGLPEPCPRAGDGAGEPGLPGPGCEAAARPGRRRARRYRAAGRGARAGQPHHIAGLPGRQHRRRLPGRGSRPGDGCARRGRRARRAPGLDHGPAPHGRGARRDPRHRRRRAAEALARGAAQQPGRAGSPPQ